MVQININNRSKAPICKAGLLRNYIRIQLQSELAAPGAVTDLNIDGLNVARVLV